MSTILSPSSSQLLSTSMISLSASTSRQTSSQITKTYRQASTLFLTRRFPESLSTILPLIETPIPDDDKTINGKEEDPVPISTASRNTRVKVWSLYLTLLNAIVELDPHEGKQAFGIFEWRAIVNKVQDGSIWDEVVRNGYQGMEGEVDADVVINLLGTAPGQKVNQQRLETYLAASTTPNFDKSTNPQTGSLPPDNGDVETPRELHARVKILELYTLHVLLRNNEWEYAKEFITISEVLDEERREAFLQALQSLREDKNGMERTQREEARNAEELLVRRRGEREAEERRRLLGVEEEKGGNRLRSAEKDGRSKNANGSEADYGIEPPDANGTVKARGEASTVRHSAKAAKTSLPARKVPSIPPQTMLNRAGVILGNIKTLLEQSVRMNPLSLLRFLMFLLGIVSLLGRGDVKDMLRRIWLKLRQTMGMGVKVSYI